MVNKLDKLLQKRMLLVPNFKRTYVKHGEFLRRKTHSKKFKKSTVSVFWAQKSVLTS